MPTIRSSVRIRRNRGLAREPLRKDVALQDGDATSAFNHANRGTHMRDSHIQCRELPILRHSKGSASILGTAPKHLRTKTPVRIERLRQSVYGYRARFG